MSTAIKRLQSILGDALRELSSAESQLALKDEQLRRLSESNAALEAENSRLVGEANRSALGDGERQELESLRAEIIPLREMKGRLDYVFSGEITPPQDPVLTQQP